MDEKVTHANHGMPRQLGERSLGFKRKSTSGFSNDLQAANDGVLAKGVLKEFLFDFPGQVALGKFRCLQDIEEILRITRHARPLLKIK